jgi:hypothetical protein
LVLGSKARASSRNTSNCGSVYLVARSVPTAAFRDLVNGSSSEFTVKCLRSLSYNGRIRPTVGDFSSDKAKVAVTITSMSFTKTSQILISESERLVTMFALALTFLIVHLAM